MAREFGKERSGKSVNMTDRADIFLEKLKEDSSEYRHLETDGYNLAEKKITIRSLMNIRMPKTISEELVKVQDDVSFNIQIYTYATY